MIKQQQSDYNYTDGCIFTFVLQLESGHHDYRFSASDGEHQVNIGPFQGPIIHSGPDGNPPPNPNLLGSDFVLILILIISSVSGITIPTIYYKKFRKSGRLIPGNKKKSRVIHSGIKEEENRVLKKLKHLFVFNLHNASCIYYHSIEEGHSLEPQMIGGFISAISTFSDHFIKKAKLKNLEYQGLSITLQETDLCRYAFFLKMKLLMIFNLS